MDKKIKVAILDDFDVKTEGVKPRRYSEVSIDSHGFMVAATVEKYSKNSIKFYYYDIYNVNNQGLTIIRTLDQCIKYGVDVVVMSFVFKKLRYRFLIEKKLKQLYLNGCTIVAADYNHSNKCGYPASSKYVVGVGNDSRNIMNGIKSRIQVVADVKPEFVKCKNIYHIFSGTSKATAIVAARLMNWSIVNLYEKNEEKYDARKMNLAQDRLYKEIMKDGLQNVRLEDDLFEKMKKIDDVEYYVIYILRRFGLESKCVDMKYEDFKSLKNLMDYIGRCYEEVDGNR